MSTETVIVTRLADLYPGDRILSWDGHAYRPARVVEQSLGPITLGSTVVGVRLRNPDPDSTLEYVLYPSQMDGLRLEVERQGL